MTSEDRPEFLITFKAATMEPGADVAPRGEVTFVLMNESASTHDFALVDLSDNGATSQRRERFASGDPTLVASVDGVEPGQAETVRVYLEPGRYFVVSNSEGEHLGLALFELTVQPVEGSEPD